MSAVETIRIGHGGTILLQLQAENMETGITAPLPEAVMASISRVKLVLTSGVVIDSSADGVGLGAGLPFDQTIDQTAGKLAITLGGVTGLVAGSYADPHLDVYFLGGMPIEFRTSAIRVLAADA